MYINKILSLGSPCERIQCLNGGYCIQPVTQTSLAYCHCPSQYTGYRCEQSGKQLSFFFFLAFIIRAERMPFVVNGIMMSEPVLGP